MKINLPEGFQIPENAKPGEPFEAVAAIIASEDGTFMLKSLDGVPLAEEVEEEESEEMEEEVADPEIRLPFE